MRRCLEICSRTSLSLLDQSRFLGVHLPSPRGVRVILGLVSKEGWVHRNSSRFVHFDKQPVQHNAAALFGGPLYLLVADLGVDFFRCTNRLWPHFVGVRPDAKLKRHSAVVSLFGCRLFKPGE